MAEAEKASEAEEKPQVVKDTLEGVLESTEQRFGDQDVPEEGAGEESSLSGHPASEESEEPEVKLGKEPGSEEEQTPEGGKEKPEEGEQKPKEGEEGKPPAEPKYKSHEEAEAAALEGQRKITQLSEELQESKDLLLKALAGQRGEPKGTKQEEPSTETVTDFVKRRRRETLDEIEALDPDDENHKAKVAEIQAKADEDILKRFQADQAEERKRQDAEKSETQKVIDQAETAMKEAGLNALPDSEDSILFWALTDMAPKRQDGRPLSLEDQIQWTINKTLTYKNQALDSYKAEQARQRAEQAQEEQPLGRGSGGPPEKKGKPEIVKPDTLGSVIEQVAESRVI